MSIVPLQAHTVSMETPNVYCSSTGTHSMETPNVYCSSIRRKGYKPFLWLQHYDSQNSFLVASLCVCLFVSLHVTRLENH